MNISIICEKASKIDKIQHLLALIKYRIFLNNVMVILGFIHSFSTGIGWLRKFKVIRKKLKRGGI